jgi:hypothetical protein
MLWSFIAVCLSAWLFVDASYRGPAWQRWVFKPLTLLLLALLAWQAPMFNAISYLVLAGLLASLLGDALTLLPRQRLLYAVGAFFLSHLLYTIYFASQMTLSFFWPLLGAGGTGGVADRRDLDASGRVAHCYLYLYWHHADDGLDGWRAVVLPPDRSGAVGIYGRIAPVHWQYCLAG